jgi:putative transposase
MARTKQLGLRFRTWGGARVGAGRRPRDGKPLVSHSARPRFPASCPLHVTLRMRGGVWNLRSHRCFTALERAFFAGGDRFGLRLIHYSVQGNHIHLLAEAAGKEALSRGMHALGVRIARALNRVMQRTGAVLADHYHARVLRTPTEVRRVRAYLRDNARKHYGLAGNDRFASSTPLVAPRTWMIRRLE